MGRAIAREPAAYLMDEPLSNLDAKLRVAMRAELVELHQRLGVTTVFVTHDQVEAMTLGQRVAILNDGQLLQFDTPREVFNRPANLFVASFIGSPAMNFVEVSVVERGLAFAGHVVELEDAARPAASGDRFIVGIRPHGFDLAAPGSAAPSRPALEVVATVVEELGAETFVHFDLDVPQVLAPATAGDTEEERLLPDSRSRFVARVDGRHEVRPGDRIELTLDPQSLYYFDARTHERVPRRGEPALLGRVEAGV
jgi:multiple sugar transport system ATP-binding protein